MTLSLAPRSRLLTVVVPQLPQMVLATLEVLELEKNMYMHRSAASPELGKINKVWRKKT